MHRKPLNKRTSAKTFRRNASKTLAKNLAPMTRGGRRL